MGGIKPICTVPLMEGEPRKMRRMAYIGVYEKPTRGF